MKRRLFSKREGEESDKDGSPQGSPSKSEAKERPAGNRAQIEDIAKEMFASMCAEGFDEDVITEGNIEDAVQNLSKASINPTVSLAQTHAYAMSSEAIKSTVKRLLQNVVKQSKDGKVAMKSSLPL